MAEFNTKCPHCSAELQAQAEWIGMEVECPTCKQIFTISGGDSNDPNFSDSQHLQTETIQVSSSEEEQMETSFIFICPECDMQAELPINLKGTKYECKACGEESIANPATEKKCPHCGKTIKIRAKKCKYCKKYVNGSFSGKIMEKSKVISASSLAMVKKIQPRKNLRKILFCISCLFFLSSLAVFVFAVFSPRYGRSGADTAESTDGPGPFGYLQKRVSVGESSYGTYKNVIIIAENTNEMLKISYGFNISFGLLGIAVFLLLVSVFINQIWEYEKKQ